MGWVCVCGGCRRGLKKRDRIYTGRDNKEIAGVYVGIWGRLPIKDVPLLEGKVCGFFTQT